MLLDEGKLAQLLQKEHKHGYDVIVAENGVTVKSSGWMVTMEAEKVPRKVLGVLVEHMGILPQAPASMTVKKGEDSMSLEKEKPPRSYDSRGGSAVVG